MDCFELDAIRGNLFIHDGPSSLAWVYDMVKLNWLIRFPRVNTAMDEPCTKIEVTTRKVVSGQMIRTTK